MNMHSKLELTATYRILYFCDCACAVDKGHKLSKTNLWIFVCNLAICTSYEYKIKFKVCVIERLMSCGTHLSWVIGLISSLTPLYNTLISLVCLKAAVTVLRKSKNTLAVVEQSTSALDHGHSKPQAESRHVNKPASLNKVSQEWLHALSLSLYWRLHDLQMQWWSKQQHLILPRHINSVSQCGNSCIRPRDLSAL